MKKLENATKLLKKKNFNTTIKEIITQYEKKRIKHKTLEAGTAQ